MTNAANIHTPDALFAVLKGRMMLGALVGNFDNTRAMRAARAVWELSPADFPTVALRAVEDPLAAVWDARAILADVPGAWDAWKSLET